MIYFARIVRPHYIEQPCKSALNRVSGMPFRWSLNPYRGCVHGRHYCYARTTHVYLGLNAGEDFTTRIMVKTNMAEVLRRELWRSIEPGTPSPAQRLAVMRRLADAGVPCGVYMAPVLPGLTDGDDAIAGIAAAACEHGATTFWAGPLRLAPLVNEHYFGFVGDTFPVLLPRYERAYPGADAPRDYCQGLERRIAEIRHHYGFGDREPRSDDTVVAPRRHEAMGQLMLPL
ncbi:MAG: hypothetical protein M3Q50_15325 [Chloroflexota bacterium]|nr:hypothetical protein [Chloroflexota bacterium]